MLRMSRISSIYGSWGLTGVAAANAAKQDLYSGMKADPELPTRPVDNYLPGYRSNTTFHGALSQIGNRTALRDRGNLHDYYAGRQFNHLHYPTWWGISTSPSNNI